MRQFYCALCAVLLCVGTASAAQPAKAGDPPVAIAAGATPQQVGEAYSKALADQLAATPRDFKKIEELFHYASRPGAEAERTACCQAGVVLLGDDKVSVDDKVWIVKLLANSGKAEVVPALAKLLTGQDAVLAETARRALQNNPSVEATAALRDGLSKAAEPSRQAAIALALGMKRDAESVAPIAKLLAKDEKTATAGLLALGDIGTAAAAKAVADAKLPEKLALLAAESQMKCAERILAAGQVDAAAAIYNSQRKSALRSIRMAALAGALRAAGDKAADLVLEAVLGKDDDARGAAMTHIADLPPAALKSLAEKSVKSPAAVILLPALADRGEKAAMPIAQVCAKSDDPEVKKLGLRALGVLGDASVAPLLFEVMTSNDPDGVARASLLRLNCPKVNETLIGLLKKATVPQQRTMLFEVLEGRGAAEVVPFALAEVTSDDTNTRKQAMRVLGKLAKPEHAAAMLPGLFKATGGERDEAEKAVMFVCEREKDGEKQAEPILAAYAKANGREKLALLGVMGRIGGRKALAEIKAAIASNNGEQREAGVRGLCNWPDDSVADDLFTLAEQSASPQEHVMALRGAVRVITMKEAAANDKQKVALLAKALKIAQRDQDESLILERAGSVRTLAAFRLVEPYLDTPATCTSASKAVCDLAHNGGLRSREKAEYEAALQKVITVCKDKGTIERARRELKQE